MDDGRATCWTVIRGAAAGDAAARDQLAERYAPIVCAYLASRWRGSPLRQSIDDASQEVFVECFREGGLVARADADRAGGFRAFLLGAVRNVARRHEERWSRRGPSVASRPCVDAAETERLSRIFDRAWARSVMRDAAARQQQAADTDVAARRRVDLLRLRFADGLPIREIARRWGEDAALVHREYAQARREFRRALEEAVAFEGGERPEEIREHCARLLAELE